MVVISRLKASSLPPLIVALSAMRLALGRFVRRASEAALEVEGVETRGQVQVRVMAVPAR